MSLLVVTGRVEGVKGLGLGASTFSLGAGCVLFLYLGGQHSRHPVVLWEGGQVESTLNPEP